MIWVSRVASCFSVSAGAQLTWATHFADKISTCFACVLALHSMSLIYLLLPRLVDGIRVLPSYRLTLWVWLTRGCGNPGHMLHLGLAFSEFFRAVGLELGFDEQ